MKYEIDKKEWHVCKICNKKIKDLAKIYGGCGIYYTQVFKQHLKNDHDLTLEEYFNNRPVCKCGICKQLCDIGGIKKSNFYWKKYKCGRIL